MMEFTASYDIPSGADQIFPFLASPEKRSLFMQAAFSNQYGIAKTEFPEGFDEAHPVGTKFVDVLKNKYTSLERRLNGEILEYVKPTKLSFRSEIPYNYVARTKEDVRSTTKVTFSLVPNSSGGTTVTWEMVNESNQTLWILNPIVKFITEKYMVHGLRQLEKLVKQ